MNELIKQMIDKAVEIGMIPASLEFEGMSDKEIAYELIEVSYSYIHSSPAYHHEMCKLNDAFYKEIL